MASSGTSCTSTAAALQALASLCVQIRVPDFSCQVIVIRNTNAWSQSLITKTQQAVAPDTSLLYVANNTECVQSAAALTSALTTLNLNTKLNCNDGVLVVEDGCESISASLDQATGAVLNDVLLLL